MYLLYGMGVRGKMLHMLSVSLEPKAPAQLRMTFGFPGGTDSCNSYPSAVSLPGKPKVLECELLRVLITSS